MVRAGAELSDELVGAAFEPLCDGVLTAEGEGGEVVLRSFFAELLEKLLS